VWEDGQPASMGSFIRAAVDSQELADAAEMETLHYKSVQLASLLNMVSNSIVILDNAGIAASANEAATRMFGFLPAQMKGQLFSRFFAEKSLEVVRLGFHAAKQENHCFVPG